MPSDEHEAQIWLRYFIFLYPMQSIADEWELFFLIITLYYPTTAKKSHKTIMDFTSTEVSQHLYGFPI